MSMNIDIPKLTSDFKELFKDLQDDNGLEDKALELVEKKLLEITEWRKTATTEAGRAQADIALDILSNDIPITIKAIIAEEKLALQISKIIRFGIKIAKIVM